MQFIHKFQDSKTKKMQKLQKKCDIFFKNQELNDIQKENFRHTLSECKHSKLKYNQTEVLIKSLQVSEVFFCLFFFFSNDIKNLSKDHTNLKYQMTKVKIKINHQI